MKTLREYANDHDISYAGAYKRFKQNQISDAFQDADGNILVGKQEVIEQKQTTSVIFDNLPATVLATDRTQIMETSATTRSNKSAFINPILRFTHIENSPVPFSFSLGGYKQGDVTVRDAVILCQRAYWGFSIFRATIELFTEFCVNNIYFKGGSKKSRDFFDLFFKKIGLNKLQDIFYRELWRSGNCFIYKFLGKLEGQEYKDLIKLFNGDINRTETEIPIKYILLNPADIQAQGNITFNQPTYKQVLSDYELERLRSPRTPQDQAVLDSLSPEDKKNIQSRKGGGVYRTLNTKDIVAVFLSKQSYEAFSVPLGFGVLEHLNYKKELELMDQALTRTVQQTILLVTTGTEKDKGGINYNNITNLRKILENESIGSTLVADYTTKAEFVIPTIGDILNPTKYEEVNSSIAIGLGNVFLIQGEKFANQNAKIDIFIQRLQGARRLFLEEFLIPEIKLIASALEFKGDIPMPFYEDIDLKNEIEYNKIYVRLMELGLLTTDEGFTAMETGRLPTKEDSEENQKQYKKLRDDGLYKPLLSKDPEQAEGRPPGTKAPQSTKKVSPIGAQFSLAKIKDNMLVAQRAEAIIEKQLKNKHKLESLNDTQKEVVQNILVTLMNNQPLCKWEICAIEFANDPDKIMDREISGIHEICEEYNVDRYLGAILYNSKV